MSQTVSVRKPRSLHVQYLVDRAGTRVSVVVPAHEWEMVIEELDELDDIRAYDEAVEYKKRTGEQSVPWEELKRELARET